MTRPAYSFVRTFPAEPERELCVDRHYLLCASAGVVPRLSAGVDDMAMPRLIARDSGWLALLPEVVVQDELRSGQLVIAGRSDDVAERFHAITAPWRHRLEALEKLLAAAGAHDPAVNRAANALCTFSSAAARLACTWINASCASRRSCSAVSSE